MSKTWSHLLNNEIIKPISQLVPLDEIMSEQLAMELTSDKLAERTVNDTSDEELANFLKDAGVSRQELDALNQDSKFVSFSNKKK